MAAHVLSFLVFAAALLAAPPVAIFLFETASAIVLSRKTPPRAVPARPRDRVGVLIPAHNEEDTLPATIASIRPQLRPGDRLLVVADNCTDCTATVAADLGAEVAIRADEARRGKGFALDFGVRRFSGDPPGIVVVVDADCRLSDAAIDRLAAACSGANRPAQALDLMVGTTPGARAREFAWRIKNWIRPLGLSSVGLPCQLMGTGMAFPWEIIAAANLATGALAEDLRLGLELAARNHPPIFCPLAVVTSEFPVFGGRSQQDRWERGHIAAIVDVVPRHILHAVRRGNANLLVLAMDAAVPPLTLLWIFIVVLLFLSLCVFRMGGDSAALAVSGANALGFMASTGLCWLWGGRDIVSPGDVLLLGARSFAKIPFYLRFLVTRSAGAWTRTDRRRNGVR